MKKHLLPLAFAALVSVLLSGCASGGAKRIESGGRESITTVGQIDIQDFITAAESASSKLLGSGALDKVPNPPAVIAVSLVVNNTGHHVDTDLLTRKIRTKVSSTGKAVTTTTVGLGGKAEDPLAKGAQAEREALEDKKTITLPDFTLSGKIIETRARAGNVRQSTFTFFLALTDKRGLAVWEGEEEISKQGKRSTVGF